MRKLDFLLADALAQGCDTVITCGDVNSNHCRATALGAARLGMRVILLLRGDAPDLPDGNLFLSLLAGAETRHVAPTDYERRDELLADAADREQKAGRMPYVIPEGGSNALGCFGYINAVREIRNQSEQLGYQFTHIVTASGSGGTQAGLMIGAHVYMPDVEVIGINVSSRNDLLHARIRQLLELWSREFEPEIDLVATPIRLLDEYVGPGYGKNVPEDLELIRRMARTQGLLLDPTYTAKAFRGLEEEVRRGTFKRGSKLLFVHTGGLHGLYPRREDLLSDLATSPPQEAR